MKEESTEHTARLTPEEVVEAYEETGWVPIGGQLVNSTLLTPDGVATGGCGLGVIGAYRDVLSEPETIGTPKEEVAAYSLFYAVYGRDYTLAFLRAFDQGFYCEDKDKVEQWQGAEMIDISGPRLYQGMIDGSWSGFKARQLRQQLAAARKEELAPA